MSTKLALSLIFLLGFAYCSPSAIIRRKIAAPFHPQNELMGVVDPTTRCGGLGTPLQLRISDCEGFCHLQPGKLYECEQDFYPSSAAASLSLIVEVCLNGHCLEILHTELANSSVQPGFLYTARYFLTPNNILSGNTVMFRAQIYHTFGSAVEICVSAMVDILHLGSTAPSPATSTSTTTGRPM